MRKLPTLIDNLTLLPVYIYRGGGPFYLRSEVEFSGCCTSVSIWNFFIGDVSTNTVGCIETNDSNHTKYTVELNYPDIAKDEFGNPGFWTLVDSAGKLCFFYVA